MPETIVCELTVALGSGPRWSSTRVIEVEATDVIRRFTIAAGATDEAGVTIVVGRDATP